MVHSTQIRAINAVNLPHVSAFWSMQETHIAQDHKSQGRPECASTGPIPSEYSF